MRGRDEAQREAEKERQRKGHRVSEQATSNNYTMHPNILTPAPRLRAGILPLTFPCTCCVGPRAGRDAPALQHQPEERGERTMTAVHLKAVNWTRYRIQQIVNEYQTLRCVL
jgi:5,10-methylenetetrahydrofolate reductase